MKGFLLLICLGGSVILQAQSRKGDNKAVRLEETKALVDSLYKAHAATHNLPGLVWAVVRGSEIVYTGSAGTAQTDTKREAGPETVFRIASMTKSFTAMAILQLRDAGKLRLDDAVSKYIPGLLLKQLSGDAPRITIHHLLTHASGFPQDDPWADRLLAAHDTTLLRLANEASPAFVTGTGYEYSNLGYALLGLVITKVAGMPYQEYIRRHIFQPLGMHNTSWEFSHVPPGKLAKGYRAAGRSWIEEPFLHDGAFGAMGGLLTSLEDFNKYMQLHLRAWPPRSGGDSGVLRRSSLRDMHQGHQEVGSNPRAQLGSGRTCATVTAYGFGLRRVTDCEGRIFIGHSGGLPGFGSNWTFMPQYNLAVVSFSNRTYAPLSGLNHHVLDTIIRMARLQPLAHEGSPILQQRQKELVQFLAAPDAQRFGQTFAPNFFLDMPLSEWKGEAESLSRKIGKVMEVTSMVPINALRGEFTIRGSKGSVRVFMSLSPEDSPRIQQVRLTEM